MYWGYALVDFATYIANAYAREGRMSQADALARIKRGSMLSGARRPTP